jgi:hypothetical protein
MSFILRYKFIILTVAILVAGAAWWGLSGSGTSPSLLSTEGGTSGLSAADQNLVATLLQLRAVKLDGTIFTEPTFRALQDFSTQIVPEPVGRPNPFAPITVQATSTAASSHAAAIFTPGR